MRENVVRARVEKCSHHPSQRRRCNRATDRCVYPALKRRRQARRQRRPKWQTRRSACGNAKNTRSGRIERYVNARKRAARRRQCAAAACAVVIRVRTGRPVRTAARMNTSASSSRPTTIRHYQLMHCCQHDITTSLLADANTVMPLFSTPPPRRLWSSLHHAFIRFSLAGSIPYFISRQRFRYFSMLLPASIATTPVIYSASTTTSGKQHFHMRRAG